MQTLSERCLAVPFPDETKMPKITHTYLDKKETDVRINCSARVGTGGVLRWMLRTENIGTYVYQANGIGDISGHRPFFVTAITDSGSMIIIINK